MLNFINRRKQMKALKSALRLAASILPCLLVAQLASAQSEADFFKGKQVRLIVGFAAGNEYDIGARLLARYLGRHIPGNPTIIVQNMPQAASIVAANYIYTQAPRDGTVIGAITRNLVTQSILGQSNIDVDPRRLIWLGGTSFPGRVCVVGKNAPVKTAADVFTTEVIVGSNGAGNSTNILPTVFNKVLGAKFKLIEGYKGTPDIILAIERDEVQGVCSSYGQFRGSEQAFKSGKLRVLFSAEESSMPELPDATSIYEFAKTEEQKQLMRFLFSSTEYGRPYVLPPDVPQERAATIRKAVADTVADPELITEAKKLDVDMSWRSPEALERRTAALYATRPDLITEAKQLVPDMR
jgi:tripartite-type tricarboxylate transporter receptor subunit TctC